MKDKSKKISLVLVLSMIFTLCLGVLTPVVSYAGDETVYIGSADELLAFAKKCSYDAYSRGKTVILTEDISLSGIAFEPIPTFSGSFDGGGHTISGLEISGYYSPAGLFATLTEGGEVKNLRLSAVISPEGERGVVGGIVGDNYGKIENCSFSGTVVGALDVGGIAGINRVCGSISGCSSSGEIIGETRTGGIAGTNEGLISASESSMSVNTIALTPSLSLSDINLDLTLDLTRLPSLFTNKLTVTDSGGIAGYCTGMILGCINNGRVGYPHVGYNVGGIAGRSSGHLVGSINRGDIFGRKDAGGIVGQIEPHISYDLSPDLLLSLKAELDEMGAVIDGAVESAGGGIPEISGRLDVILESIDYATDSLNTLINSGSDYVDGVTGEINRTSEVLSEVISQLSGITADIPKLSGMLSSGLASLEASLSGLEGMASIGKESLSDLKLAADDASAAFESIENSLTAIEGGLESLKNALTIEDKAAAEAALSTVADGLSELVGSFEAMTKALSDVNDVLSNAAWIDKGLEEMSALADIFGDMTDSVAMLYEATAEIRDNIDIHWSKITEAGEEISSAIGHLAEATGTLTEAFELMDSGVRRISDGLEALLSSVSINDGETVDQAIAEIKAGFDELIAAGAKATEALTRLSEIMAQLEAGGNTGELLSDAAGALGELASAGGEAGNSLTAITGGISTLLENIEIDTGKLSEGGALVIEGLGELSDSIGKMRGAAESLSEAMTALDKAIKAANDAVIVKDEAKLKVALDKAFDALGQIIASIKELSSLLGDISETLKEAKLWSDGLFEATGSVTDALSQVAEALTKIQSGVDELRSNIKFDIDSAGAGLELIGKGLSDMSNAAGLIADCLAHLSDALADLDEAAEYAPKTIADLRESIAHLKDATGLIGSMAEKIHGLVGYLDGVDPIQLPSLGESVTEEANRLFIYISAIENELKALNGDITKLSSELVERVGRLNSIFTEISDNIVDTIYGLDDEIVDSEITEEDAQSITSGRIYNCQNEGDIQADKNAGGIGGAMGIEYSLDPEDDTSGGLSLTQKKQYKLSAVIQASISYGSVTSKYDGAGGIVGRMDMGLVYGAENYGAVESLSGSYVGGIAGITSGLISGCFAKCTLSGKNYVGGIIGSGVGESVSGGCSTVRDCYSMVEIVKFTQYGGAVAGVNVGEFSNNLFVSESLNGIDRISYSGKAEPISYEELVKRRYIPEGFYSLTLDFVADGQVIHSVSFEYGASFDGSVFPEIPEKEGHYGRWDRTELTGLLFDTTVSVVYKPYTTTIDSDENRESGKEIFFAIGKFTDSDKIITERGCDTSSLVLEGNAISEDRLVESWTLTIPKDQLDANNIHFLPADKDCKIYVKTDGVWHKVETKEFGSYLTFDVSGETVELAVVKSELKISIEIIVLLSLVVIQAVIIAVILVKRSKKKKTAVYF